MCVASLMCQGVDSLENSSNSQAIGGRRMVDKCPASTPSMGQPQAALPSVPDTHSGRCLLMHLLLVSSLPRTPLHFQEPVLPGVMPQINNLHPICASWSDLGESPPTKW